MNTETRKILSSLENKLLSDDFQAAYSLTTKLRSSLIGTICEIEIGFPAKITKGEVKNETITLTINEPLPPMKGLTASVKDYWLELIHSAIGKAAESQKPPYFAKRLSVIFPETLSS